MLYKGYTNSQIVTTLKRLGFRTFIKSLKRCLQRWGYRRSVNTFGVRIGGVTDKLAKKVNYLFYYTTFNDDLITARIISDYSLQTIGR
jgi:hypothetical protein